MKQLILLISFYLLCIFISNNFIEKFYDDRKEEVLYNNLSILEKNYSTSYKLFTEQANTTFESLINREDIKEAFASRNRDKLYDLLKEKYKFLASVGYKQIHFHTPDNVSFLRMHKPEEFGDDLTNYRYTLRYVNEKKIPIHGIETGRVLPGYRNVYPVFYKNEYLGSVELSFSIDKLINTIEESHDVYIHFLMNKDKYIKAVFKDDRRFYKTSNENHEFVDLIKKNESDIYDSLSLDKETREFIRKKMTQNEQFALEINNHIKNKERYEYYSISFIPVFDVEKKERIYFVYYENNKELYSLELTKTEKKLLSPFIILLIFISLYLFIKYETSMQKSKDLLKQEKELLNNLFNNVEAIVATIKPDGTMNRINDYTKRITGYTQEEIASKPYFWFENFIPSNIQPDIKSLIETLVENGTVVAKKENEWIVKNGERRLFEWSNKVIFEKGEPVFLLTVGIDITERKNLELELLKINEELIITNESLDETVKNRTKELLIANEKLSNMHKDLENKVNEQVIEIRKKDEELHHHEKLKSLVEMLENISHHWRQPLNLISITTSGLLLKKKMDLWDDLDVVETLNEINRASQNLSRTIDDFSNLLDLSMNAKNQVSVNLSRLLKEICNDKSKILGDKNIELNLNFYEQMEIKTFPDELELIINNIINNSIEQFEITKTLKPCITINLKHNEDKGIIEIIDNAGGIEEKYLNKIFEPYFTTRFKSADKGLGLYYSYQLMNNLFKGKIIVENIDAGVKFSLELNS